MQLVHIKDNDNAVVFSLTKTKVPTIKTESIQQKVQMFYVLCF